MFNRFLFIEDGYTLLFRKRRRGISSEKEVFMEEWKGRKNVEWFMVLKRKKKRYLRELKSTKI